MIEIDPQNAVQGQIEALGAKLGGAVEAHTPPEKDRAVLTEYLTEKAPHLLPCVEAITEHPRWVEAVAITRIETQFCTKGHGPAPKNNCGNISSSLPGRPNGRFKTYRNKCDALEDIAILLETPRYKDKGIAEANGLFCIEEGPDDYGQPCRNWTEVTMEEVNDIRGRLTT